MPRFLLSTASSVLVVLAGLLLLAASGCSPYPYPNVSTTVVIEWDWEHLTIEKQVEHSDIIAVGSIVKVDAPRWNSPDGKVWRPPEDQATAVFYTTFYVEPTRLLKGTPKWGTPVAFRVMRGIAGGDVQLSVGDEVVAFGASDGRWGPGGIYQPAGAYWLTMENNSIWIEQAGVYRNQGHTKDPAEASLSLEELEGRVAQFTSSSAEVTTTTSAAVEPPSTTLEDTGPWFGEAEFEAASLMLHNQFFSALQEGDVGQVEALLVEEQRGEAETLCASAQERQESRGPEAAWGGMTRPLVWTGEKYAWDPPLPVPDDLDRWIREHPEKRLGLQIVMGDNALWWLGMERSANGSWLVRPGLRDEEYALSHTLAGLATLQIDATPRAGVHVTVRLRQLPDSGAVSADLVIDNKSDSLFTLAASDLSLVVDGNTADFSIIPHSPGVLEVRPGQAERPGNGWGWHLEQPTSRTTRLSYTATDPRSDRRTWVAEAAE